jgi:uncharacterized protein (TIGR02145 family)
MHSVSNKYLRSFCFPPLSSPKSKSAYDAALFEGVYEFAAFWTADEAEDNTDMAYYRYLYAKAPHLMIGKGYKSSFGASVRCVRESY